jgi:rfaE bifunctional protein nucleotidyltransferase chain/domain
VSVPGQVVTLDALMAALKEARAGGARIVLTNGVFDLLHVGHLRYLRAAREYGDHLVVGINADASVSKPGRPVTVDAERAELVAALDPVDFVVIFSEPTADALLRAVRPDVYVKGADYSAKSLPEAATAKEVGARLAFVPLIPERSTTALLEYIRNHPG